MNQTQNHAQNSGTKCGTKGLFVPLFCPACPALSRPGTKSYKPLNIIYKDADKLRDNSGTNLHLRSVGQIFRSVPPGQGVVGHVMGRLFLHPRSARGRACHA